MVLSPLAASNLKSYLNLLTKTTNNYGKAIIRNRKITN